MTAMEPLHVHIPYVRLRDFFEFIKKRKYDLEIYFPSTVLDQLERPDLEKLRESLDWDPALTLHAPFVDMSPGAIDPMVKSVTQLRFRQIMNVAAILKPRAAVFHAGYDRWRYSGRKDIWLDNSLDTWARVMDSASKTGMRVAVENVFDEDPEALSMLIEKVNSPDFGFCFDTGHFNIFSTVPMEQWFDNLGKRLVEVHLHDNDGTDDFHWALGRGDIDFKKFFHLLRRHSAQPVYTIEAHDKDDVEVSIEKVRGLLKDGI